MIYIEKVLPFNHFDILLMQRYTIDNFYDKIGLRNRFVFYCEESSVRQEMNELDWTTRWNQINRIEFGVKNNKYKNINIEFAKWTNKSSSAKFVYSKLCLASFFFLLFIHHIFINPDVNIFNLPFNSTDSPLNYLISYFLLKILFYKSCYVRFTPCCSAGFFSSLPMLLGPNLFIYWVRILAPAHNILGKIYK